MINMTEILTDRFARRDAGDLDAVEAIQRACPEAAHWKVADYLDHDFRVAIVGNCIAGFIVLRKCRGRRTGDLEPGGGAGIPPERGREGAVEGAVWQGFQGAVFLEVRESNEAAIEFYKLHNFQEVSRRPRYYDNPPEAAIVMKFHSC